MAQTVIFAEQKFEGFAFDEGYGAYRYDINPAPFTLVLGETYQVVWDNVTYVCVAQDLGAIGGGLALGNLSSFGLSGNDEPFVIGWAEVGVTLFSFNDDTSHHLAIYQGEAEQIGIVLKNYSGDPVTYPNVEKVMFNTSDGGTQIFSKGVTIENVPILLDFSSGEDQTITAPDGTLVKSAVIEKPVDLVAENIRLGKRIANIDGDFIGDTEEIAVDGDNDLTFADGDFVVNPSSAEKVISKVTISKPSELIPANVAKGVTIAGVEGTHEGGGGGGSAEWNIAYGETEPADTSKLWIKGDEPTDLLISAEPFEAGGDDTIEPLSTVLPTTLYAAVTAIVGDKVYLCRGYDANGHTNTIYVFDVSNNKLELLSQTFPVKGSSSVGVAVGSKIYVFGGNDSSAYVNTIYTFDTSNNAIQKLSTTLANAMTDIGCAVVGTKIYLFGGTVGSANTDIIQVFDTTNNTIQTLATKLPSVAKGVTCAAVGSKIYLFGGEMQFFSNLKTINVFDTTDNTIETLSTTTPNALYNYSCAVVGTNIYLFGGSTAFGGSNMIYVFDTTNNEIVTLSATLPHSGQKIGCVAFGSKIYLFGGQGSNAILTFSPSTTLHDGSVRVVISGESNLFSLLPNLKAYIHQVFRGNASDKARLENAYLYVDGEWMNINPIEIEPEPEITLSWRVEAVDGASYGFALDGDYYVSQNKGIHSSAALCKVVVTSAKGCTATFNCINYAEGAWDFGILSVLDKTLATSAYADTGNVQKSFKGSSMSTVQKVEYTVPAGEHFVYVKFYKDGGGSQNNDTLQFNVTLTE